MMLAVRRAWTIPFSASSKASRASGDSSSSPSVDHPATSASLLRLQAVCRLFYDCARDALVFQTDVTDRAPALPCVGDVRSSPRKRTARGVFGKGGKWSSPHAWLQQWPSFEGEPSPNPADAAGHLRYAQPMLHAFCLGPITVGTGQRSFVGVAVVDGRIEAPIFEVTEEACLRAILRRRPRGEHLCDPSIADLADREPGSHARILATRGQHTPAPEFLVGAVGDLIGIDLAPGPMRIVKGDLLPIRTEDLVLLSATLAASAAPSREGEAKAAGLQARVSLTLDGADRR